MKKPKDEHKRRLPGTGKPITLKDLTERQRRFVRHYIKTGHGTGSVKAAGYKHENADITACQLLGNIRIHEAIRNTFKAQAVPIEALLGRFGEQALATLSDFIDDKGRLNEAAYKERGYLLKEMEKDADGKIKVKLHDAQKAGEIIAKLCGWLNADTQINVGSGGMVVVHSPIDPLTVTGPAPDKT